MSKGILLVNLGSPDSAGVQDVKKYLGEFLMDGRVIDLPWLLRFILVKGIILNTRPKRSARAYASIWQPEGSPLINISKKVQKKLAGRVKVPVGLAMRYGSPSVSDAITDMLQVNPGLTSLHVIPLYPHYALASYETVVEKVKEVVAQKFNGLNISFEPPFYENEDYLDALAESIREHQGGQFDYYLFSYHGIPYRHLRKTDMTGSHCTKIENCCEIKSQAHTTCYRHQITVTTHKVAAKLGLKPSQYSITFQSRLKGDKWLQPYTDVAFETLPAKSVKRLAVVCPAFVSDCLETLEEIAVEGKKSFMEAGGEYFKQIPCLNDRDDFISVLEKFVQKAG